MFNQNPLGRVCVAGSLCVFIRDTLHQSGWDVRVGEQWEHMPSIRVGPELIPRWPGQRMCMQHWNDELIAPSNAKECQKHHLVSMCTYLSPCLPIGKEAFLSTFWGLNKPMAGPPEAVSSGLESGWLFREKRTERRSAHQRPVTAESSCYPFKMS